MNAFHDALNATLGAKIEPVTDEMQAQATRELNAAVDALGATALRIRDERDQMAATLRDLAFGATLLLDSGVWTGAALSFIKEVKRVAEAGLREGSVS